MQTNNFQYQVAMQNLHRICILQPRASHPKAIDRPLIERAHATMRRRLAMHIASPYQMIHQAHMPKFDSSPLRWSVPRFPSPGPIAPRRFCRIVRESIGVSTVHRFMPYCKLTAKICNGPREVNMHLVVTWSWPKNAKHSSFATITTRHCVREHHGQDAWKD